MTTTSAAAATTALTTAASCTLPRPPIRQYHSDGDKTGDGGAALTWDVDLTTLASHIHENETRRQEAYDLSRRIHVGLVRARRETDYKYDGRGGETPVVGEGAVTAAPPSLDSFWNHPLLVTTSSVSLPAAAHGKSVHDSKNLHRKPRMANLSHRVEEYVRWRAFRHFLDTGQLVPPQEVVPPATTSSDAAASSAADTADPTTAIEESALSSAAPHSRLIITDEEYLAGACMGLAMDLQRYGLGRATVRDVASVEAARNLMEQILSYLLQLDFRNGPLRRKYDATKYSLKGLETLLYELAITTPTNADEKIRGNGEGNKGREQASKRAKPELLPNKELEEIKHRMERRDDLRERLIKQCRDGQKAAKQAIFALHRGDRKRATTLLEQCGACIRDKLLPVVLEEPPLRYSGSYTGVLEEFVEARLFDAWLHGNDDGVEPVSSPAGVLLRPENFAVTVPDLEPEEYLGGLCDLTGEVGRYAVQCGTARDVEGVRLCLRTNDGILAALETVERLPGQIGKKMEAARRSVEKLERMLYEMSLSEAAGGRNVRTDMDIEDHRPGAAAEAE